MTQKQFAQLKIGDVIQNVVSGLGYIVVETVYPKIGPPYHVICRHQTAMNESEWKLVYRMKRYVGKEDNE